METGSKVIYFLAMLVLPLVLMAVNIMVYGAAIFPMIFLFLWLGFSIFMIIPLSD